MAEAGHDWLPLRGSIAGFAGCLILGLGLVTASLWFAGRMERQYHADHAAHRRASAQLLSLEQDARLVREWYPEFVTLQERGIVGAERRLNWLETLHQAAASIGLPELRYELGARAEAAPWPGLTLGEYRMFASSMRLQLGLVHAGDLLDLLAFLDRHARGYYEVRSCDLELLQRAPVYRASASNIRAHCELNWLTLERSTPAERRQ